MAHTSYKVGVLVAQLGTPQAPTAAALRPYLREFLPAPRVVDLNPLKWYPILYGIVLTFRPRRSAALYAKVWTEEGSPLLLYSKAQTSGLQERLGDAYEVILGMRYGEPSIDAAMRQFAEQGIERILVFPMYPQFSCSTTGSIYDAVNRAAMGRRCPWFFDRKRAMPTLRFVPPYYDHPAYIDALAARVRESRDQIKWQPDCHLITFHGIPQRYVDEGDPYRSHCEETARLLANALELPDEDWKLCFQSRFGRETWLQPYTDETLEAFGEKGVKNLLATCPGFTSDCLETIDEIGREGLEEFTDGGGEQFHLSPCLNDHPMWMDAMAQIAHEETVGWVGNS